MNMRNKSTMAGMVLAGLATGAAAWYLFGTSKGKEVSDRLMDSMKNLSSNVSDKAHDMVNQVINKTEDAHETVMA